ncbi:MAG: hypothetical protein HOK98_07880 [Rhodospirillaceae bacterium]|nr:hypothetical protein [Rhodospirillaceae bacterium]MBT6536089.1 hypothetical protein [Rhodospirillaceae bacterium]
MLTGSCAVALLGAASLTVGAIADDPQIVPLPDRDIQAPEAYVDPGKERLKDWMTGTIAPAAQQIAEGQNPVVQIAQTAGSSIQYMIGGLSLPDWLGRFEVEAELAAVESGDNLKPEFSVLTVQPLFQNADKTETYFTQLQANYGHQFGDDRIWVNAGVGYREVLDNNTLIGANTFLDYDVEEQHLRASLGGEFKFNSVDISANYYQALSDEKTVTSTQSEEALSGYDAEIRSQLPYLPWARMGFRHYFWNTESAEENIKGYEVNLEMDVHQNFQVELAASDDNFGEQEYRVRLRFINAPDKRPVALSNKFITEHAFEARDMREHTLDKVRRENKIILEGQSSGVVIARGT